MAGVSAATFTNPSRMGTPLPVVIGTSLQTWADGDAWGASPTNARGRTPEGSRQQVPYAARLTASARVETKTMTDQRKRLWRSVSLPNALRPTWPVPTK